MQKEIVKEYWDNEPCGTRGVVYPEGTRNYYDAIAKYRYSIELFIDKFVEIPRWKGKKVLEIGCGVGTDLVEFAKEGVKVTAIDLSSRSVEITKKRLNVYGLVGDVLEGDAENMMFGDSEFDMVYSCGVLHHTPDIEKAIDEIYRVLKPSGEIRIMLYHKPSIVCLQMYLLFGLLRFRPFRSIDDILANHHESKGTKAYTINEAKLLFRKFRDVKIDTTVTAYDIRYAWGKYLPMWCRNIIPKCLGWYILVRGRK